MSGLAYLCLGAPCKTVGLAYVGSNPTPATTNSQVRPGPLGRVSCVAGAVWGTVPQATRVGCRPCSGWSGCCEHGEWLAVLGALLTSVVEQWLSSRARDVGSGQ